MEYHISHRHRTIISADGFGISPRANRNTRYLLSLGKINRIGVMVNGVFSSEEIKELLKSNAKIDIHLDISDKSSGKKQTQTGNFRRIAGLFLKLFIRKSFAKRVETEWKEQIEKFIQIFGKKPDGISSHQHVHFLPPLFKVALKLQTEYSIPYIRFGKKVFTPGNKPAARILNWLRLVNCKACRKADCVSSENFIILEWIGNVEKFLNSFPEGTVEIACRPEFAHDFVKIKQYF